METQFTTYRDLLGPLGDKQPKVWADCLFADPVGDIAVLGGPDIENLYDEWEAYDALTDGFPAMPLAPTPELGEANLLMLDGRWSGCRIKQTEEKFILIREAMEGIHGGMSGSPILDSKGRAVGLVSTGWGRSSGTGNDKPQTEGVGPSLANHLPPWLLRELKLPPFPKSYRGEVGRRLAGILGSARDGDTETTFDLTVARFGGNVFFHALIDGDGNVVESPDTLFANRFPPA